MSDPQFLCALDLPEQVILGPRSAFRVEGWIIPGEDTSIDAVWLEVNGSLVATSHPLPRPDVGAHYPMLSRSASSGFATPALELETGKDCTLDLRVIAESGGARREVHGRRVRVHWFDSREKLFKLGQPAPFAFPEEFDAARLPARTETAPAFLLGNGEVLDAAAAALKIAGRAARDGEPIVHLMKALVACHDAYVLHRRARLDPVQDLLPLYAIGRCDIYAMMDAVVEAFEPSLFGDDAIHLLRNRRGMAIVPLLRHLYPSARFAYLVPPLEQRDQEECEVRAEAENEPPEPRDLLPGSYAFAWHGRSERKLLELARAADKDLSIAEIHSTDAASIVDALGPAIARATPRDRGTRAALREAEPVFVLGAGRSGTSAMVGALQAAGFEGAHEGHVLPLLQAIDTRLAQVLPEAASARELALDAILDNAVASAYGHHRGPWLDKTPDHPMIECVPLVLRAFPRARFVMMRRHPVSFIESRRRKFGEAPLSAATEWVRCAATWEAQRDAIDPQRRIECDAAALRGPDAHDRLAGFFGLDASARKGLGDFLSSERPELTRDVGTVLAEAEALPDARKFNLRTMLYDMVDALGEHVEDTAWTPEEREQVMRTLGDWPARLGYALHRPTGHLGELVAGWARTMEMYRHTAEHNQAEAARWEAIARDDGAAAPTSE